MLNFFVAKVDSFAELSINLDVEDSDLRQEFTRMSVTRVSGQNLMYRMYRLWKAVRVRLLLLRMLDFPLREGLPAVCFPLLRNGK
jgi:hypothetical protein